MQTRMPLTGIPKSEPYLYNHRRRLPAEVYEDNYSYAMNYYQPMLDYLEARDENKKLEPPHLPWVCERGYPRYDTKRPISKYSSDRIPRLASDAKKVAKHYLDDYRFDVKRSVFSVRSTALSTRLDKHLKDVSGLERIEKRLQERNAELVKLLDAERQRRVKHLEKKLKEAYENTDFDFSPSVKEALRGKNEKQIAKILWHDSVHRQLQTNFIYEDAVREYEEKKKQLALKYPKVFNDNDENQLPSQAKWVHKNYDNSVAIIKSALKCYARYVKELNEKM